MDAPERWWWIEGRIGRLTWLIRVGGAIGISVVCVGLYAGVVALLVRAQDEPSPLLMLPVFAMILPLVPFRIVQDIKRLHDLGQSGWLAFCAAIPVISLIYLVVLIAIDGQARRNDYGPDPKRRDESLEALADVFR